MNSVYLLCNISAIRPGCFGD